MSLMRLTIIGLTLSGLIATSTQAETCRPDPPITGSYVNSCSDCTIDSSCNTMTCLCDSRKNRTSISLATCPSHHFCNAGGYLQCGEGCHD